MATVQETFEFINSLTIPKKQSRPVVYKSEDPKRKSADDHGRGGRNGGRGGRGRERGGRGGRGGPSAENPCLLCGAHDHWISHCPKSKEKTDQKESDEAKQSEKPAYKREKTGMKYLVLPSDTLDLYDILDANQRSTASFTMY